MNAQVKGINVKVLNGDFDSTKLFLNSIVSNKLSSDVLYIYPAGTSDISTDDVRNAFADLPAASVKQLGEGSEASYQVRIGVSETDKQAEILSTINNKLYSAFGKEKVAVVKTDFIGSTSSKSNTIKGIIMFVCTMILIWAYAAIRFHAYCQVNSRDSSLNLINSLLASTNSQHVKSFLYYQRSFLQRTEETVLADLRSSLMADSRNSDSLFRLYEIYFEKKGVHFYRHQVHPESELLLRQAVLQRWNRCSKLRPTENPFRIQAQV